MTISIATLYFYLQDFSWSYEKCRRDERLHISAEYLHSDLAEEVNFAIQILPKRPSGSSRYFRASIEYIDKIEGPEGDILVRHHYPVQIRVVREQFDELLSCLQFATNSVRAKVRVNLVVEGFVAHRDVTQSPELYAQVSNDSQLKVKAFGFELEGQC